MNPAIQGLLATIEQACTITLNRARNLKLTDEQVQRFIEETQNIDVNSLASMMGPAKQISEIILADHRELILRNTYDSLDTLASLSFEEYCEYQKLSEERLTQFMLDLEPIFTELFETQIFPNMMGGSIEDLLGNMFEGLNSNEDEDD